MARRSEEIEEIMEKRLPPKRFSHTLRVVELADRLAVRWHMDREKIRIAALLHDYAKNTPPEELAFLARQYGYPVNEAERDEPILLHGPVGALMIKRELGISDPEILDAVTYHTTGKAGLSLFAQIIYLADALEAERSYPGVEELRKLAETNLQEAFLASLESTLRQLLKQHRLIHPLSVEARNWLLIEKRRKHFAGKRNDQPHNCGH